MTQNQNSFNRRQFLAASGLTAASGLSANLYAAGTEQEDISRIGKTPHTRFAVNVEMWWKKLPFIDRIRKTASLGFPAVEFWPYKNKNIDEIAQVSQSLNVEIAQFTAWGFTPGMNDPKNHKDFINTIRESCQVAKKLKCRKMTVVGGNDQPGMTQEQMHENIITALKLAAPIAEDANVMMILEPMNIRVNHKGHCLYGSEAPIRICKEVNSSHVKINWDLYHMQITEGDLCRHMKEGFDAGQIGYLQLADNPGRNEPGTGEIYYNRVLKEAFDIGYKDYVGLECTPIGDEIVAAKRVAAADVW
jgi:hydroxypyruvate isomerase